MYKWESQIQSGCSGDGLSAVSSQYVENDEKEKIT